MCDIVFFCRYVIVECEDQDTQQRDPKTHDMYLNVMRRFSQALLKVYSHWCFQRHFSVQTESETTQSLPMRRPMIFKGAGLIIAMPHLFKGCHHFCVPGSIKQNIIHILSNANVNYITYLLMYKMLKMIYYKMAVYYRCSEIVMCVCLLSGR